MYIYMCVYVQVSFHVYSPYLLLYRGSQVGRKSAEREQKRALPYSSLTAEYKLLTFVIILHPRSST